MGAKLDCSIDMVLNVNFVCFIIIKMLDGYTNRKIINRFCVVKIIFIYSIFIDTRIH